MYIHRINTTYAPKQSKCFLKQVKCCLLFRCTSNSHTVQTAAMFSVGESGCQVTWAPTIHLLYLSLLIQPACSHFLHVYTTFAHKTSYTMVLYWERKGGEVYNSNIDWRITCTKIFTVFFSSSTQMVKQYLDPLHPNVQLLAQMFPAICQANIQPHAHSFILIHEVTPCSQLFSFLVSKLQMHFHLNNTVVSHGWR